MRQLLNEYNGEILFVEEIPNAEKISLPEIKPDDIFILLYTLGSTGKPKDVMIPHSSAANFFTNNPANIMVDILVNNVKNFVNVSTFSFNLSLKELALPLFSGLTLVLADDEQANNPAKLTELIRKTGGDAINATPSRLYQYMESEEFTIALRDFKFIGSGGEKYFESLLKKLRENTSAKIINTYGPTETTISSNMADLTQAKNISVGQPLFNVTEFIVDSDGNEFPPGIVGELYIGGAGVGKGYNKLPAMTAERFIEYNGLRIEIGEIESALTKIAGIETVVVKIVKIKNIDIENLKTELAKTLSNYMVPTAYLQMEKMPLTFNGKIDLKSLPEANIFRSKSGTKNENKIEKDFCEIFEQILQVEQVGADESFFDLGGTSLLVTRVVIMAQKLGYKINFSDVFTSKTPRELAALQENNSDKIIDAEIENYDYTKFEKILASNTLDNFKKGKRQPLGNIILTSANGYLGLHILQGFIKNHGGKIYCLLRGKKDLSAQNRLRAQLYYYFDENYAELFGKRIFILEGDVTRPETLAQIKNISDVSTVIDCAALVKHFSSGNEIENVNVDGVKNFLEICKAQNLQFILISTMSTVRTRIKSEVEENVTPTEKTFYFKQSLTNKYVRSKFLAERLILNAVAKDGLNAKIMRVGTLSARYSDGEFQINAGTNSSMGRLKINVHAAFNFCSFL